MRTGRMTAGQTRALEELWPTLRRGVSRRAACRWMRCSAAPRRARSRSASATANISRRSRPRIPERDYFGIEVHRPGVGHLLMLAATHNLTNVRASAHDAVEVLREQIAAGSLDEVLVLFPDPWHKKRHHKRRLIQPPFVELIASRLRRAACSGWLPTGRSTRCRCSKC